MPGAELTINVTEFKARSLRLLDDIARGTIDRITVTKRGKPVAIVSPSKPAGLRFEDAYGSMKDVTTLVPGVDLTESTLHPEWEEEMLRDWDELNR